MELERDNEWELVQSFLPEGWEAKARELGAFKRARQIKTPAMLLRLILLHVGAGLSLRSTTSKAEMAQYASLSDVALLKRLRKSADFLQWLLQTLMSEKVTAPKLKGYRMRLLDGTTVKEPGKTGSSWRLHYSLSLPELTSDFVKVTPIAQGETIEVYPIRDGDLILADRNYSRSSWMAQIQAQAGALLMRWHSRQCPLYTGDGKRLDLLKELRKLKQYGQIVELKAFTRHDSKAIPLRVCAMKRSPQASEKEHSRVTRKLAQNKTATGQDRLEFSGYIVVVTTLSKSVLDCHQVLQLYRARWQIELVFKRLKSLLNIGYLPKYDPDSSRAWLYAKLILAVLIEKIAQEAHLFSPGAIRCSAWALWQEIRDCLLRVLGFGIALELYLSQASKRCCRRLRSPPRKRSFQREQLQALLE